LVFNPEYEKTTQSVTEMGGFFENCGKMGFVHTVAGRGAWE
jgi:hypothetical protein